MKRTYEEILESMKTAYFNECTVAAEKNSRTMKCFEILASELFSVSCYGDYIFKQAFVQTATGKSLDMLGELRGCERKTASRAFGKLTFSISQPSETDIIIPENTVCSVSGKPYIQFATTEQSLIKAGELSAAVNAAALEDGEDYNVKANTVKIMVNAPVSVEYVINNESFKGGCSNESDDFYRNRILRHYAIQPNGINCASYENKVLMLDYVTDCKIFPASDDRCMIVCVSTKSGSITDEQYNEIAEQIAIIDAAAINYDIITAEKYYISVKADACIMTGFDKSAVSAEINHAVRNVFSAVRIDEYVTASRLEKAVADIAGLKECSFYSDSMRGDTIRPGDCEVLTLDEVEVNCVYD